MLEDDTAEKIKPELERYVKPVPVEILGGLSSSHGSTGLATFERKTDGVKARIFRRQDLASIKYLQRYSRNSGIHFDDLKKPLSLIVCMLAESARIPIMGRDFVNMYYGCDVIADEAIRSYDNAKQMMRLAREKFPEYPNRLAVEKLAKRADEMSELLKRIEAAAAAKDRVKLVGQVLTANRSTLDTRVKYEVERFRDMCVELKFEHPDQLLAFVSAFSNASAVRAAKQGVAYPNMPT